MTLRMIQQKQLESALHQWYVVQTQVKKEQEVKFGLIKKGYEVFLPLYKKLGPKGKGELLLPLFSGYLFTQFDQSNNGWQEINRIVGVSRILGYDADSNTIAPCRDNVIPGLQSFCDEGGIVDMKRAFPTQNLAYAQGDVVKILKGMFEGQSATYWNTTKNGAMVILSLLNRPVRVILRNEEITKA